MSYVKTESFEVFNLQNNSKLITLIATDGDSNNYTFNIINYPSYGVLSNIKKNYVTYTPNNNYVGYDSFTYNCSDKNFASEPSTISINNIIQISCIANIFESSILTIEPTSYFNTNLQTTYSILDSNIAKVIGSTNKILLKNTGNTTIIAEQNDNRIYINLKVYYLNKNSININLYSPTLAYQKNTNRFYKKQISENNKILNSNFSNYNVSYFNTSYDRILYPKISNIPY